MQPLQLTAEERVGFTEQIKEEFSSGKKSSSVLQFEKYDDVTLVLEYSEEDDTVIFSMKIGDMISRVASNFVGCPRKLEDMDSPAIESFCEEVDTALWNEFSVDSQMKNASFTFYEWETDEAWYIYEVEMDCY